MTQRGDGWREPFDEKARTFWSASSAARTESTAFLVLWLAAALWGWFIVGPRVLAGNPTAREIVALATSCFPLLDNFRRWGPPAEKALFLHSVFFFATMPLVLVSLLLKMRQIPRSRPTPSPAKYVVVIAVLVLAVVLATKGVYDDMLRPDQFSGRLHRTGYSIAISPAMVPIAAPFFMAALWFSLLLLFYFVWDFIKTTCRSSKS
jgi:hypothetical protein